MPTKHTGEEEKCWCGNAFGKCPLHSESRLTEMVRDFTQIFPPPKSEVRQRILDLLSQERELLVGEASLALSENKELNFPSVPESVDDIPDDAWLNGWFEAVSKARQVILALLKSKN